MSSGPRPPLDAPSTGRAIGLDPAAGTDWAGRVFVLIKGDPTQDDINLVAALHGHAAVAYDPVSGRPIKVGVMAAPGDRDPRLIDFEAVVRRQLEKAGAPAGPTARILGNVPGGRLGDPVPRNAPCDCGSGKKRKKCPCRRPR